MRRLLRRGVASFLPVMIVTLVVAFTVMAVLTLGASSMTVRGYVARTVPPGAGTWIEQVAQHPVVQTSPTGAWRPAATDEPTVDPSEFDRIVSAQAPAGTIVLDRVSATLATDTRATDEVLAGILTPASAAVNGVTVGAGEAVLSPLLAARLGLDVGDDVLVGSESSTQSVAVVMVSDVGGEQLGAIVGAGTFPEGSFASARCAIAPHGSGADSTLLSRLNGAGATAVGSISDLPDDTFAARRSDDLGPGSVVGAGVVSLLATAGGLLTVLLFVSAQSLSESRRRTEARRLRAVGFRDRHIRLVDTLHGGAIALSGAVVGCVLGFAGGAAVIVAGAPRLHWVRPDASALVVLVVVVISGASLAAWIASRHLVVGAHPARRARRTTVRMRAVRRWRWALVLGVYALVVVWAYVAASPTLAWLSILIAGVLGIRGARRAIGSLRRARMHAWMPLRFSVREVLTNEVRSRAAVALIAVCAFGVIVVSAYSRGQDAVNSATYVPHVPLGTVELTITPLPEAELDPAMLRQVLAESARVMQREPVATVDSIDDDSPMLLTAADREHNVWPRDIPILTCENAAVLGYPDDAEFREACARGEAVGHGSLPGEMSELTLTVDGRSIVVPVRGAPTAETPLVALPPEAAARLGLETQLRTIYFAPSAADDDETLDRLRAAAIRILGARASARVSLESGFTPDDLLGEARTATYVLAAGAAIISVLVSILVVLEGRRNWALLLANGASRRQRQSAASLTVAFIGLAGGVAGTVAALVATAVATPALAQADPGWAWSPDPIIVLVFALFLPLVCVALSPAVLGRVISERALASELRS